MPDPLEAEVRVAGPQLLGPAEGGGAELAVGECGEGRIDLRHGSNLPAAYCSSGSARMAAPAWLGIGAQRSGTTWFTDLLTQHPQVGLGTNGKKEQHLLHKVADGVLPAADVPRPVPGRRRTPGRVDAAVPAPRLGARGRGPAGARRTDPGAAARPGRAVPLRDAARRHPAAAGNVAVALPGADHGADLHRLLRRPAGRVGRRGRSGADGRDGLRAGPPGAPGRGGRRLAPARPRPGAAARRRGARRAPAAGPTGTGPRGSRSRCR